MNERDIFIAALERATAEERSEYLSIACASDSTLRQRVEDLLQMHEKTGEFLQKPVVDRLAEEIAERENAAETAGDPFATRNDRRDLGFLKPSDQPDSMGRMGHYEVQEVIGQGGMGTVLRAFDGRLHRVVAIKVMAPQLATSAAARKRFIREAQAAAAVSHDHVVTIHAVEEAGGLPYLAMQYVSGMSLQQRLDKSGPLELREIVRIGMQTAAGLAAAHAQGLIHRDIKPANILLENGVERVKITDFGLARAVADASVTQTGMVAGTPQYMSPEQARGEAVDRRSDLFSLGSVLYAMCTGRPPFRGDSGIAVLKRVCDDTPRSIRETNPDIPEWLEAFVAKLHAKDPAERHNSAAEVAELLNEHLAHLQHPSVVPLPAAPVGKALRGVPSGQRNTAEGVPYRTHRLWATAAAVLLCLALGLGLAEATGTTQLTATVIRIFTQSGTLVVEVDDPGVKVTVEGDGGLVITGAGPQEVRLRPGNYKVRATKDGKSVREEELITITRGDKRVVKVSHESGSTPASPTAVGPAEQPFVVLGEKGVALRNYETLADAVLGASDGDTIEVRGNGPFVSEPINIVNHALTIRAGEGFRPVIKVNPERLYDGLPLIRTNASLVLEGLELHRVPPAGQKDHVVVRSDAALWAANCRFRDSVWTKYSPACVFQNCEFLSEGAAVTGSFRPGTRLTIENCLALSKKTSVFLGYDDAALREMSVHLKRSSFAAKGPGVPAIWISLWSLSPNPTERPGTAKPVRLEVSDCILDASSVLNFMQDSDFLKKAALLQPAEAEATLRSLLEWRGERNVFGGGGACVKWYADLKPQPPRGPKNLQEWKQYWSSPETDSLEGRLRFQGGNLSSRIDAGLDHVTPEDFRLRPDSPGYRAGKDGKDLGADIDLVGPGPAYERWKKMPAYQQWLEDTGQNK